MAPMATADLCDRNHKVNQRADQPVTYMKVQADIGPLNNPDDSFVLNSLLASPALMGFDLSQAETMNWEDWSKEQENRLLTMKVKVAKDYNLGGFQVSLLSVLPSLDSLGALPAQLNINLD